MLNRYSAWDMAGVQARAFGSRAGKSRLGETRMRLAIWIVTLTHERREHPDGTAVCLLGPKAVRIAILLIATVLASLFVGDVGAEGGMALVLAVSWIMGPSAVRYGKRLLRSAGPHSCGIPGGTVIVHSLASIRRGAGAELMVMLTDEADRRGWMLSLEADGEELVQYYERFGFRRVAETSLPVTERGVPMTRRPSCRLIKGIG